MSEALSFGPKGRSRSSRSQSLASRILLLVIGLLAVLLTGEILFHFVVSPRLVVTNLIITSDLNLSKEQVLEIAGLQEGAYYFSLEPAEIRRKLEASPLVEKAAVEKDFPDTVRITLQGRKPLVTLLFAGADGRTLPLVVDRQGVVFQIDAAITAWDLPLLSGVQFTDVRAGVELPATLRPFLADLETLRGQEPELFRVISEIRLAPMQRDRFEILLYPVTHRVRLRLGERLSGSSLRSALMILDLLQKQDLTGKVQELDLRTGEVVYRIEEG